MIIKIESKKKKEEDFKRKKLFAVCTALIMLFTAAAFAETAPFTIRGSITFGMNMDDVMAAETARYHEIDNEHTLGPVDFTELEYENVTENGMRADLKYLFVGNELVAVQLNYDTEDRGVSYQQIKDGLVKEYGEPGALDLAALGNGIYAVDDEGRPEGRIEVWLTGNVMIVLERDDDDVDVTYVDLTAAYVMAEHI